MRLKPRIIVILTAIALIVAWLIFKPIRHQIVAIDRDNAEAIANNMFVDYTTRTGREKNEFSRPIVQITNDGWEFNYNLNHNTSHRLSIFVDKSGKSDYSEAP